MDAMDIERRAGAGDAAAQFALAQRYDAAGRSDLARGWLARAAQSGDAAMLRRLAVNLLTRDPIAAFDGVNMIRTAAERGDAEAAHLCAVLAGQDSALPSNWTIALDYLARAAALGSVSAREQLRLLARAASGTEDWPALAQRIDIAAWLTPAPLRVAHAAPRIAIAEGFATAAECDLLIARGLPLLKAAEVYDPQQGGGVRADEMRNNSAASFDIASSDLVLVLLRARIAALTGIAADTFEPAMALHYATGQQFAPHFDFIDPAAPHLRPDIARHGQRVATFLVYLSDDYEGGETDFPEIGWRHKGRKGDALLFWNVAPDGTPDRKTLHAGLAPLRGEKWLLSQWIRRP